MNPLDFIPKSLLGVAILALLTTNFSCAFKNKELELEVSRKATQLVLQQKAHADAVVASQSKIIELATTYRAKEQAMQTALNQQREKTDATITQLAIQRDDLKLRLKAYSAADTSRSGGTSADPGLKAAIPRVDLALVPWQVDGLVDEAFRADQIRVELLACYAAYNEAMKSGR